MLRIAPVTDSTGRPPWKVGLDFTPSITRPRVFTGRPMAANSGAVAGPRVDDLLAQNTTAPASSGQHRGHATPRRRHDGGRRGRRFFARRGLARRASTGAATNSRSSSGGGSAAGAASSTTQVVLGGLRASGFERLLVARASGAPQVVHLHHPAAARDRADRPRNSWWRTLDRSVSWRPNRTLQHPHSEVADFGLHVQKRQRRRRSTRRPTRSVRFDGVSMRYGRGPEVLSDVSLQPCRAALSTSSPARRAPGKSSLLKLIYLAARPSPGAIAPVRRGRGRHAGRATCRGLRRRIGVVFQDLLLLDHLSAFDNAALPLRIAGAQAVRVPRRRRRAAAPGWAWAQRMHAMPPTLAGGEKQRLAIARAVVDRPEILLADEPTGNVDHEMALRIYRLFVELNRLGTTVIIATHDQDLVARSGRPVLHLDKGRLRPLPPQGPRRMSEPFDPARWRPAPFLPEADARDPALLFVVAVLCFLACLTALGVHRRRPRGQRLGRPAAPARPRSSSAPAAARRPTPPPPAPPRRWPASPGVTEARALEQREGLRPDPPLAGRRRRPGRPAGAAPGGRRASTGASPPPPQPSTRR